MVASFISVERLDFARHPGEEFEFVLTGSIDVHFDTGEVMRLERGDSLYFDSRIASATPTFQSAANWPR